MLSVVRSAAKLFRRLSRLTTTESAQPLRKTFRPQMEQLEDRLVPATHPLTAIPVLHSNEAAAVKIYLDFDGHSGKWGDTTTSTPAFDRDGDMSTFSDGELGAMRATWERVADDFSPFNVDVTTVNPFGSANASGVRVAIGGSYLDWYWDVDHKVAGGVAGIGSFVPGTVTTVYVFSRESENLAHSASHEVGHALGLAHQGEFRERAWGSPEWVEYSTNGFSSFKSPIMGYGSGRSIWWEGLTFHGTETQPDMHVLATRNGFGYRADDYVGASTLPVYGSRSGVISSTRDQDTFNFTISGGTYTLYADSVENLDARLEVRDSRGLLLFSVDPAERGSASITTKLGAGQYSLTVASHGDYGDVGQYTVGIAEPRLHVVSSEPSPDRIRLTFNNPVDPSTIRLSNFGVSPRGTWASDLPIAATAVAGSNNRTWEFTFSKSYSGYRFRGGDQLRDRWGNAMNQSPERFVASFVLEDYTAPRVTLNTTQTSFSPYAQKLPVLQLTFSEQMYLPSLNASTIEIRDPSGRILSNFTVRLTSSSNGWVYAITLPSGPGTYTVTLKEGIKDLFGNSLDSLDRGTRTLTARIYN